MAVVTVKYPTVRTTITISLQNSIGDFVTIACFAGKRKSFLDSDTAESCSSSSCSKNDRSSSSSSSSHSSRSSRVDDSRRRRTLSGSGVDGKENSAAKRKVQIVSKVFQKGTAKQDSSNSRVLKPCPTGKNAALLSDEVS
jgi:hypothetical protein